jgi:hypothetical protein
MKNNRTNILFLILLPLLITSCQPNIKSENVLYKSDPYSVIKKENPIDSSKTDIFIHNSQTKEEFLFISLRDVYKEHYHFAEYHNGNLYIILRKGYSTYPDEDWIDELWRFNNLGEGERLFSNQGLDFRVSPNEEFTSIIYYEGKGSGQTYFNLYKLIFINYSGEKMIEFNKNQLGSEEDLSPEPYKWSIDSSVFWGNLSFGPSVNNYFKINVKSWKISIYKVSCGSVDKDLNPNTGGLVCSDYPVMMMAGQPEEFVESKRAVILYYYDLENNMYKIITTSVAKRFSPKWISDIAFEYNDPKSDGRIIFNILE